MISEQAGRAQGTRAETWPKEAPLLSEAPSSAATPTAAVPHKYKIKMACYPKGYAAARIVLDWHNT